MNLFSRTRQLYSRILLAIMLVTFLSPSLGWGMVASHEQISHGITVVDKMDFAHDHHHSSTTDDADADGHDLDAHTSIGHLLTHMPVCMLELPPLGILSTTQPALPFLHLAVLQINPPPPFHPPRSSSLI